MNFLSNTLSYLGNKYAGTDTPLLFKKNLKIMPDTWHYRTKNIDYKYNTCKYRTSEFENIDWNKSIVIFGCSMVFGVGVDEHETLSYYIEKYTGIPTINLGLGASSIYHSYYNLLTLLEMKVQPIAIVNVYTALDRLIYYNKENFESLGNWTLNESAESIKKNLYKSWTNNDSNYVGHARVLQRSLVLLCQHLKYYECSYFEHSAISLGIPYLNILDKARDLMHPGFESNKKNASFIIQSLKL